MTADFATEMPISYHSDILGIIHADSIPRDILSGKKLIDQGNSSYLESITLIFRNKCLYLMVNRKPLAAHQEPV